MERTPLCGTIFAEVFILANRLQILGDRLPGNITTKQWLLLAVLIRNNDKNLTVSEVAEQIGYTRQAVMKLSRTLQAKGFLRIEPNPDDKRALLLKPTTLGIQTEQLRAPFEANFLSRLFASLDNEQLTALAESLESLLRRTETMEAE